MPWPYTTQWYFEDGTDDGIGSLAGDGTGQSSVAHYTDLARFGMTPYTGAYSFRVVLDGTATTAFIDDTDAAMATDETAHAAFALYLSSDFALAASAVVDIWLLQDATVDCAAIRLINDSGTLRFQVTHEGDETDDVTGSTYDVTLGRWMWVEMEVGHDTSAEGGISTLRVTVEGEPFSTQVAVTEGTTSASAAPDGASLGVATNATSGNVGTLLFDAYHWHDPADVNESEVANARITKSPRDWNTTMPVDVTRHVFVGPGCLENLQMIAGDIDAVQQIRVYDTDRAETDPELLVGILSHTAANEVVDLSNVPIQLQNGCYIEVREGVAYSLVSGDLDGSSPRAIASVRPRYYGSRSQISNYGLTRPPI